jgi:hypothetical protein
MSSMSLSTLKDDIHAKSHRSSATACRVCGEHRLARELSFPPLWLSFLIFPIVDGTIHSIKFPNKAFCLHYHSDDLLEFSLGIPFSFDVAVCQPAKRCSICHGVASVIERGTDTIGLRCRPVFARSGSASVLRRRRETCPCRAAPPILD